MTLLKGFSDPDTFTCWVPAQAVLVKGSSDGADKSGKRWIQGVASTDSKDLQGEIVNQKGIDFSYFLKSGYFNEDHKPGFEHKVGQPTECKVTKQGLWVKGFLFKNHKSADAIWELLNSLEQSDSTRRVGFSIQGKVKRRQGTVIDQCWIQDVAITPAPVNNTTWCEIAKSLSSQAWSFHKESAPSKSTDGLDREEAIELVSKAFNLKTDEAAAIVNVAFGAFSTL